ncbi:hypothetical protein THOG11_160086 [Vibrio harveyi]|nr:hypothetical protein TH15OA1_210058 [Vibrio harveyi]CAH1552026.1 hypothetical protein THOD03_160085 [Vibrio harveyi]CAH1557970.1 hypothetical protein THOG11_160086 [Vibrio harveyi]
MGKWSNFNKNGNEQQTANVVPIKYQLIFNRLAIYLRNCRDKKTDWDILSQPVH